MEVVCMEDRAFFALLDRVIKHIRAEYPTKEERWITGAEAMKKLNISSRSSLLRMRNEGCIRFSQPKKKIILYDNESIKDYLNKHAKEIF